MLLREDEDVIHVEILVYWDHLSPVAGSLQHFSEYSFYLSWVLLHHPEQRVRFGRRRALRIRAPARPATQTATRALPQAPSAHVVPQPARDALLHLPAGVRRAHGLPARAGARRGVRAR